MGGQESATRNTPLAAGKGPGRECDPTGPTARTWTNGRTELLGTRHIRWGRAVPQRATVGLQGAAKRRLVGADLELYGRTGFWGEGTVTVDHLWPQSWGGSDEIDNLRLAHGSCNSRRGTRDVELVRTELAGTSRAPLSSGEKTAWSIAAGGTAAMLAGYGFAHQGPDGGHNSMPEPLFCYSNGTPGRVRPPILVVRNLAFLATSQSNRANRYPMLEQHGFSGSPLPRTESSFEK
jgi:5-methylcytosine-specific restriction endonuclease McrA